METLTSLFGFSLDAVPWGNLLRAALLVLVGLLLARLYRKVIVRGLLKQLPVHHQRAGLRLGSWLILLLFALAALNQLGFKLSVLLGAAGVLSVALGFASQTSAANVISGLFLIGERSFQAGDTIQVGDINGEVLSVDLLSVKLRTPDNLYVRIPNETLIKGSVINLSRFPIRRFDLKLGIAYAADIARARQALLDVAAANPLCLEEPKPEIVLLGFGESSVDLQLSVWAASGRFGELRNSIQEQIKRAFDAAGIDIPFPHRTLHLAGEVPLRVQLQPADAGEPGEPR